jgi:hypothetical protein
LEAVNVKLYVPLVPTTGVPLKTPVDALNVTPVGNAPDSLSVGTGEPLAVTTKLPTLPTLKAVVLALVIAGPSSTVRVKPWLACCPTLLEAVNVKLYVPPVPTIGVPLKTPVDASKVTPVGNAPDSLSVGTGEPLAVTRKLPALPTLNPMLLALVIAGPSSTVRVKPWLACCPTLLEAVNVRL